jgi:XTP/dITP diphosphohydrolase
MKLLIATSNAGKVTELAEALDGVGFELLGLGDLPSPPEPPEETGATFEENALLKARFYHERSGLLTVADDSGVEVNILGGRPGVESARYAPTDPERIERLLGELDGVPKSERTARFVCALALVGENLAEVFTGVCGGHIRHLASGDSGFGFDPIFVPEGETRSFAEMGTAEKALISHRGRAIEKFVEFVRGDGGPGAGSGGPP